jgi:hypothetical protein
MVIFTAVKFSAAGASVKESLRVPVPPFEEEPPPQPDKTRTMIMRIDTMPKVNFGRIQIASCINLVVLIVKANTREKCDGDHKTQSFLAIFF